MKRRQLQPREDLESQTMELYRRNQASMSPRQFEDAKKKVTRGVRGVKTNVSQWRGWST